MQNDRKIWISTGTSRKSVSWQGQELLWSEFVERLARPTRTPERLAEYKALTKGQQDDLKDIGGFVGGRLKGPQRRNENGGERHLITLDADNIPAGATQAVLNAVDGLGCAYVVYSTRKHEGGAPRLRIVVPLDVPCEPEAYEPIARKLASFLDIRIFDPTTFELVRMMYWPSCSVDSEYVFLFGDKPFLSSAGMLDLYQDWHNVAEWPEVPGAVKLRERSAKKQGDPTEKRGVVGAFCKVYDIPTAIETFIPDAYAECGDGRYTYTEGSTVGGAVLYDDGKFLYSHHATDPASGKLCNAFDLVRLHLFGDQDSDAKPETPATRLPSFQSMCEFAVGQEPVSRIIMAERYEAAQEAFGQPPEGQQEDLNWLGRLKCNAETGQPLKTIDNVVIILNNDPKLRGRFYHDEFANRASVRLPLPWEPEKPGPYRERPWADEDDAGLRYYIEKTYGITGKDRIYDGMAVYATNHKENKIRDYLRGLTWDRVPRLDTLLIDYFGALDTAYTRAVTRKTFSAGVARVLTPGVKFDSMLILSGPQGIGKTTLFRYMGRGWHLDGLTTFEGKEAAELIQGYWIIEAGELTGLNKSEMNTVKQFLSRTDDVYRIPYSRRTGTFPRTCIIVGTTNDTEFLKDRTGNRRFWPVDLYEQEPTKDVFTQLPDEVDQIWAEALVRWQCGEKLYLEGTAASEALVQQEEHQESDPREGIIREFLERKIPADWNKRSLSDRRNYWAFEYKEADPVSLVERDRVCAAEIWCECFGGDFKLMRRSDTVGINAILANLEGWERAQGALKYGKYYGVQKGFVKQI